VCAGQAQRLSAASPWRASRCACRSCQRALRSPVTLLPWWQARALPQCHGKNLFYFFGAGDGTVVMHVHFGMSGAFRTSARGEEPEPRATTRLKLVGADTVAQLSAMTVAHGGLGALSCIEGC